MTFSPKPTYSGLFFWRIKFEHLFMSIPAVVCMLKCPHLGYISASNVCWGCTCAQNIARPSTEHMMNERSLVTASWFLFFLFMSLGCKLVSATWYWTHWYFCPSHWFCMDFYFFFSLTWIESQPLDFKSYIGWLWHNDHTNQFWRSLQTRALKIITHLK